MSDSDATASVDSIIDFNRPASTDLSSHHESDAAASVETSIGCDRPSEAPQDGARPSDASGDVASTEQKLEHDDAKASMINSEGGPLLAAKDSSEASATASARVLIMASLASISCAAFLPYAAFMAGVGHWTQLYGITAWVLFNLMSSAVMPTVIMAQFYFDSRYNVMFGAGAAYAFRLAFGVFGSMVIVASIPWAARDSSSVWPFYLYSLLYPIFSMSICGAISQITSYMTPEMVAYLRVGSSAPAFLVLLLVAATSYHHDADFEATTRFHAAVAVLIVCCGSAYLLLPQTVAIRLILRLESAEKPASSTSFFSLVSLVPMQLLVCQASSLLFQTVIVSAPFMPSSDDGQLAQKVVLTALISDVVGKLAAASPLGAAARATPAVVPLMCALNVCASGLVLGLYVSGVVPSMRVDAVPCAVAAFACCVTGFVFTVANQMALGAVPLHDSAKLICIFNLVIAISCIAVSLTLLLIHA
jgi:hypothetical protein